MLNLAYNEADFDEEEGLSALMEVAATENTDNEPTNDPETTITADNGEVIELNK